MLRHFKRNRVDHYRWGRKGPIFTCRRAALKEAYLRDRRAFLEAVEQAGLALDHDVFAVITEGGTDGELAKGTA